jgi:hypothetical protein
MIGNRRGHRRCTLKPFVPTTQSRQPPALVLPTEVVDRPDQIHSRLQRFIGFGQCPTASHQTRQALPKPCIQSLDEGRVDDALALCARNPLVNIASLALHDATLYAAHTSLLILFNHLRNEDSRPSAPPRTPQSCCRQALTKDLADGAEVSFQAVRAKQQAQRQSRGASAYWFNQPGNQGAIATMGKRSAQPQAGAEHHGQGHPDDAALLLDSQFIHLHLAEIAWGGNPLLMHRLAMQAGTLLPIGDGALVYGKGSDNGLSRAAVRKQGDDLREALIRMGQSLKRRAFGFSEGRAANRAAVAALFLRMNGDVACLPTASSRASEIRTKYCQWVQSHQSFRSGIQKGLSLDLHSIQNVAPPRLTGELPKT